MSLPQGLTLSQTQNTWATQLDPLLNNPLSKAIVLKNISLTMGANIINHNLGRKLQGWYPVRIRSAAAAFYDTQDTNTMPHLTLNLTSSADVVIDLVVF